VEGPFGARLRREHEKEKGMDKDGRRIVETAEVFAERLARNHGEDARLEVLVLCARVSSGGGTHEGEPDFVVGLGGDESARHLLRAVLRVMENRTEERWYPDVREEGVEEGP
jgi:hypothetical protein